MFLTDDNLRTGTDALDVSRDDDRTTNLHRQLIGWIGVGIPVLLIALVRWRDGKETYGKLDSISAYYYSGADAAFLGMLVSLALFLFTYRGYVNMYTTYDRRFSNWAGVAALVVAFFPTEAPDGIQGVAWWTPVVGVFHYSSAAALFSCFAVFSLWLFSRKAEDTENGKFKQLTWKLFFRDMYGLPRRLLSFQKDWRSSLHIFLGVVIIFAMGWAWFKHTRTPTPESIFWPEVVALVAFSSSWLIKGYGLNTLGAGIRNIGFGMLWAAIRWIFWWTPSAKEALEKQVDKTRQSATSG